MLVRARFDGFLVEDKFMSPADASEEAAVAGLLGLNSEDKPVDSKQPAQRNSAADTVSQHGKRSVPAVDGCDSTTQTDSVTLTDGANDSREREVDSGCRNGSDDEPIHRKRQKTGAKVPSSTAGDLPTAREEKVAPRLNSEGENNTASLSAVPFTLASAAQAAGVWNPSAARPLLPKMPTMTSATEVTATPHGPNNTWRVTPFGSCEGGSVLNDNVEHADALHRESGADPISHHQQNIIAAQQHLDLAAFLNESSTRTIPSEALQKLLQQCTAGKHLSITDFVRAVQQSSQTAHGTAADDATNATHTSTVSTMDAFPAHSSDTRATPHAPQLDTRSHPSHLKSMHNCNGNENRETEGTAACDTKPPCANARSLFVQLSDAGGSPDAAKASLERTATPIVPGSAGTPPGMPFSVGSGPHRTRSSSGAPRSSNRPLAHSLTPPLPAYRHHIGHAVPVTSHQKHKSDLLNNPESRNLLWFPEKVSVKNKNKFQNNPKRAADNRQQGLAAERLQAPTPTDSASKSALPDAQDLTKITSYSPVSQGIKKEHQQISEPISEGYAEATFNKIPGADMAITPDRVENLLSLVSQLAVFADGGVSGVWCRCLHHADCARARSLFRRALELQAKGTTAGHLAPLLTAQANVAAAIAAFAASGGASMSHALVAASSFPQGLQTAAANIAMNVSDASQQRSAAANRGRSSTGTVAAALQGASSKAKRSPRRRSSAVTSTHAR